MAIVIPVRENWVRKVTRLERERCRLDVGGDVLSLILARLFMNLGPSSKLPWRTPYLDSPCLIFRQNSSDSWKIFHSLYNEFYIFDFPELKGEEAEILYAKDGWLLMSGHGCTLFFFNPSTRAKMALPPLPDCCFISVCFTSAPTSGDCRIFGLLAVSSSHFLAYGFIRFGEEEWELGEWESRHSFWIRDWPPIFCNGMFYLLDGRATSVNRFDPTKEGEHRWEHFGLLYEGNGLVNLGENEESDEDEDNEEEEDDDSDEDEDEDDEEEEDDDGSNDDEEEEDEDDGSNDDGDKDEEEDDDSDEEEEDDDSDEEEDDDEEEEDDDSDEEEDDDEEEEEEEEYAVAIPEMYMVEVEGDIWSVFLRNKMGHVCVEKLDLQDMRWRKLDSLGDRCLYISKSGSFAEGCLGSEMANKIYFDRFYGKNSVIYCMNSRMYHSVSGDYASKEVAGNTTSKEVYGPGLTQPYNATWIKPYRN